MNKNVIYAIVAIVLVALVFGGIVMLDSYNKAQWSQKAEQTYGSSSQKSK